MQSSWETVVADASEHASTAGRGLIVGVDGIDGAGKTTLVAALLARFSSDRRTTATKPFGSPHDVMATDLASGLTVGQVLYDFALNGSYDFDQVECQLALAISIRRHERVVLPRLRGEYELIVTDRSSLSASAYALATDDRIAEMVDWVVRSISVEDVILWLDVEPSVAFARRTPKQFASSYGSDSVLSRGLDYQQRAAEHFSRLAGASRTVIRLDADRSAAEVFDAAASVVERLLSQ